MSVFGLAFAQPWLLLGLLTLPGLWWLLRTRPPPPKRQAFPPLAIIARLVRREETPATSPWWLLALRLIAAAAIIAAFAGPRTDRMAPPGSGPLTIVLDDGWSAAPDWSARIDAAQDLLDLAEADARPVRLLGSAPPHRPDPLGEDASEAPMAFGEVARARAALARWEPRPWPADRAALAERIAASPVADGEASVWIADRTTLDRGRGARALARALEARGPLEARRSDAREAIAIVEIRTTSRGADVELRRASGDGAREARLTARDAEGAAAGRALARFAEGERAAVASFVAPTALRAQWRTIAIEAPASAGGTALTGAGAGRPTVGLVSAASGGEAPLLEPNYFLERALAPIAEIARGPIATLADAQPSMIALADGGALGSSERAALERYMEKGGVFLRFAGPNLAAIEAPFAPTPLRSGSRELGGALSWAEPLKIGAFSGPLADLAPPEDVVVRRQVLSRAAGGLNDAALARLEDGTPLITGRARGDGWFVLIHTTANAAWSTLPLSGSFPALLERLARLASSGGGAIEGELTLIEPLDGHGRLGTAPREPLRLDAASLAEIAPGPEAPPGFWAADADREARLAHGGGIDADADLTEFDFADLGIEPMPLTRDGGVEFGPWLLVLALFALALDGVASAYLRGAKPIGLDRARSAIGAAVALMALGSTAQAAELAQLSTDDLAQLSIEDLARWSPRSPDGPASTRFAHVLTGDGETDRIAEAGLEGLTRVLARRTAIEAGPPDGVDPASDPLAFYPILYWPIVEGAPPVGPDLADKLEAYMANGGLLVLDSRDDGLAFGGGGAGREQLAAMFAGVDFPPLEPVDGDHALTRSFYLLQTFPGRFAGGALWVGESDPAINDGVSSVIVGGADWIGAWAVGADGAPLLPATPGGERQRETARRFGVNLAMYALTGSYKTDQVHVPALLERLGQ